jgi:hypothetical protein
MTFFSVKTSHHWLDKPNTNIFELAGWRKVEEQKKITPDMDNATISKIVSSEIMEIVNKQFAVIREKDKYPAVVDLF